MKSVLLACSLLLLASLPCFAQSATPAPPSATATSIFSTETDAVVVRVGGQSVPGTDLVGAFHPSANLAIESHNVIAPGANYQGYFGGARYNLGSQIDKLLSKQKTNVAPGTLNPFVRGFFGIVRNVPANGPTVQHYGGAIGGGVDFNLNSAGTWTAGPAAYYLNSPGFGKSPSGVMFSANLTFVIFGK